MLRSCANCGTEVDETAVFCPTCGQPIDQDVETEIPPAPSWPDPEPEPVAMREDIRGAPPRPDNFRDDHAAGWDERVGATEPDDVTRVERRPADDAGDDAEREHPGDRDEGILGGILRRPSLDDAPPHDVDGSPGFPPAAAATLGETPTGREPASRPGSLGERMRERAMERPTAAAQPEERTAAPAEDGARRAAAGARGPARRASRTELPLTVPVTLSAWLIGGGALLGAVGGLLAVFDGAGTAVDILLLVGLLGVAATVFLANNLPSMPQLRLATLVVILVAFGVALDRLGFGRAGAGELLLFLGTAAAAMGVILVETGNDQPLGGPSA
jgi:hypothetical protein